MPHTNYSILVPPLFWRLSYAFEVVQTIIVFTTDDSLLRQDFLSTFGHYLEKTLALEFSVCNIQAKEKKKASCQSLMAVPTNKS